MIFFAIPFFKNTAFLKETLQSLVNQSSTQWQALVFDDSIDPEESESARQTVSRLNHPQIRYHKNPKNIGMANNWNQGLKAGTQESTYLATTILHADDRLLPDYVSEMLKQIQNHPEATAFFCQTRVINEQGQPTFSFTDFYKKFLLPPRQNGLILLQGVNGIQPLIDGNFIFCPTFCFRNEKISRLFRADLKMVTDFELTLDLLLNDHLLVGLYERPLFEYRRHGSNTTKLLTQNLERFQEERDLYLELSKRLSQRGEHQIALQAGKLKIIRKNLAFQIVTSVLGGQFALAKKYFHFLKTL
jgi:glycosyltransferase involved in cell wall biosynthesis